jgi:ABC-type transporter Mla MlaB component
MTMTEERTHTLVLTGDAGIKSASDVAGALLEAIEHHDRIAIDTQTVSGADVTTIQTLLSARASAHARHKQLTLLAPLGGPLQAVLEQAGFTRPEQEHARFWTDQSDQPAGH